MINSQTKIVHIKNYTTEVDPYGQQHRVLLEEHDAQAFYTPINQAYINNPRLEDLTMSVTTPDTTITKESEIYIDNSKYTPVSIVKVRNRMVIECR